ncbi:MAG: glycosyltransferase family 4 protein [Actinomycetes bacterium]
MPIKRRNRYDAAFYVPHVGQLIAARQEVLPTGGAETQVLLMAKELARRGLKIAVIVFDVPGGLPDSVDGVDIVIRRPYAGGRKGVGRLKKLIGAVTEVLTVIWVGFRFPAETIIQRVSSINTGLIAVGAKLGRRRFVWASANTVDFEIDALHGSRAQGAVFRTGVKLADDIVVQTKEQIEMCISSYGRTPTQIFSISEPAEPAPLDRGPFLWIGRLVNAKQPLAFLEIAEANPDLPFAMIGVPVEGADQNLISAVQAKGHALANVELLDPQPRDRVMQLIASATAVVNTSLHEGMPNVFLEGWARGVPAVSLHHDPDGVITSEGLGFFASGNPSVFGDACRRLMTDRPLREELSDRCRMYIKRTHSPQAVGDQWRSVIGD